MYPLHAFVYSRRRSDGETPEIPSRMNIKYRVLIFLAIQFWQYVTNVMGIFLLGGVDSQYNSCVHGDTHITTLSSNQCYVYPLIIACTRARFFSEIINFQTPVNPSRVKRRVRISPAVLTILPAVFVFMGIHISLRHEIISDMNKFYSDIQSSRLELSLNSV